VSVCFSFFFLFLCVVQEMEPEIENILKRFSNSDLCMFLALCVFLTYHQPRRFVLSLFILYSSHRSHILLKYCSLNPPPQTTSLLYYICFWSKNDITYHPFESVSCSFLVRNNKIIFILFYFILLLHVIINNHIAVTYFI
jgi:hypothetical protein